MKRILLHRGRTCIFLHTATLLFGAYAALQEHGETLLTGFFSILLHEGAHALAAVLCGYPPDSIDVTPLGAMLTLHQEEQIPPLRRLIILLAGPAATLCLCACSITFTRMGMCGARFGYRLFTCNLALLAVNFLPCLPLDGGRMLALILSRLCCAATVRRVMRLTGSICGTSMVLAALWLAWQASSFNLSLVIVGCFLLYAAHVATATAALEALNSCMQRKVHLEQAGVLPASVLAVMAQTPVSAAVRMLHPNRFSLLVILEEGTLRRLGLCGEDALIAAYLEEPSQPCGGLACSK